MEISRQLDDRKESQLFIKLDNLVLKSPLTVELLGSSPLVDLFLNCSFTEIGRDRKFRRYNKLTIIRLKRGTDKEKENE